VIDDLPPTYEETDTAAVPKAGFHHDEKMARSEPPRLEKSSTVARSQLQSGGPVVVVPTDQFATLRQGGIGTLRTMTAEEFMAFAQRGSMNSQITASQRPETLYNQPETYDPARREISRASELSSLSSGFGDADIIIADVLAKSRPVSRDPRRSNNFIGRFSWMSRRPGDRETVYTASSEDRPTKYRTVTSWVNQQTGRLKRAQARQGSEAEIPPVPDIPARSTVRSALEDR
jgi:hypothetical protein